jgi:hypothetical protein
MRSFALAAVLLLATVACTRERERAATPTEPSATSRVAPTSAPTAEPTPTPNLAFFRIETAMDHVRALGVEIGKREAGTEPDRQAAAYIRTAIERLGWDASEQTFPLPQGGESTNVIGKPPGFDDGEPYLIVGGHRDSIRGPGANDNATGVAAALEIVRALQVRPAPLPVMFIAFGAEERQPARNRPHHIGSVYYVSKMSERARDNLVAFVNLDMIGHGDVIICGRMTVGPREGTQRCVDHAKRLDIAADERVLPNWSDHGSFQAQDMNTAWLWTGDDPCCYHNPRDTIDRVRPADVARAGKLALAIVRSYTGSL